MTAKRPTGHALVVPGSEDGVARASDAQTWAADDSAPRTPTRPTRPMPPLGRGDAVGRYVVLDRVGTGGMGVVYAAYDPELDRKIGLKLLHAEPRAGRIGPARLLREAQALARLNHPNVVTVHDVGEHAGRVFLAMEFVEGKTLRSWLAAPKRSWREFLAVFFRAGEGLAAAHATGLVHRDFKPENVMVGDDGRVRVMDFGLARSDEVLHVDTRLETSVETRRRTQGRGVDPTMVSIAGTPAYMAPEQHLGQIVDARSDQFSFCVALYEALHGERPFDGEGAAALAFAVTRGRRRQPSAANDVPGWLQRVVDRGLAVDPDQRFGSMQALLAALADDPTRRRRRIAITAGLVVAIVVGAAAWQIGRAQQTARCQAEGDAIAQVWGDEARARVEAGMLASGASFAGDTALRVMPWLDRHAAAWREATTAACATRAADDGRAASLHASAQVCLDDRKSHLAALVDALAASDAETVRNAVHSASRLPAVATCSDDAALARFAQPTAQDEPSAQAVSEIRRALALARTGAATGRRDRAAADARELLARAREIGWAPLVAEARLTLGTIEVKRAAYDAAQAELTEAWLAAQSSGHDEIAVEAATALVQVAGYRRGRVEEGLLWGRQAGSVLARGGRTDDVRHAMLGYSLGVVHGASGAFAEAREDFERVLDIQQTELGTDHPDVAATLTNLGNLERANGAHGDARAYYRRALAIQERVLGPDHPDVARSWNSLGSVDFDQAKHDDALVHFERALEIWERALGPDHPDVAGVASNIASVREAQGRYDEALAEYRRVATILERALGPDHPDLATALHNLGAVQHSRREYDDAEARLDRALAIREAAFGAEHPTVAATLAVLGNVQHDRGDHDAAQSLYQRALAIRTKALGARHPLVADALNNLGVNEHSRGELDRAETRLREALSIREEKLGTDHLDVAATLTNRGNLALDRGMPEGALADFERAARIREKALSPDHPHLARSLTGLGRALVALDRHAEAIDPLERALVIREHASAAAKSLEETRSALAAARAARRASP